MTTSWMAYLESVPDHLEPLLRLFRFIHLALKVVGVGSVGNRFFIILFEGKDFNDPFFLQIKEAGKSVLEDHLPLGGSEVVSGGLVRRSQRAATGETQSC